MKRVLQRWEERAIAQAYERWAAENPLHLRELAVVAKELSVVDELEAEYRQQLISLRRRERDLEKREKYVRWQETMVWADAIRERDDDSARARN